MATRNGKILRRRRQVTRSLQGFASKATQQNFVHLSERCTREMGLYGWSMVKYCADEDIDAERALNDMLAD